MATIGFDAITAVGAAGAAVGAAIGAGLGTSSTKMQVDLDEAPKLIAGLKSAIEKLQEAYRESEALRATPSPGKDPYSDNATEAIRKSSGNDAGGYGWANLEAQKALLKTIENIEKSVASYSETDSSAGETLKTKD